MKMIPKMIEVHLTNASAVSVNIDHIEFIGEKSIKIAGKIYYVNETYNELIQLINNAGCTIQHIDERLDLKTPLSLADFKYMVGQPVWDNNLRQWGLVLVYNSKAMIYYSDTKVSWISENDMKESQFYRMRV